MGAVLLILGASALVYWWSLSSAIAPPPEITGPVEGLPEGTLGTEEKTDAAPEGAEDEPAANDTSEPVSSPVLKSSLSSVADSNVASPYHVFLNSTLPEIE